MKSKQITDTQKKIIEDINDPLYTVEFLQEWINRNDDIEVNAFAALQAMGAKGFFSAVTSIEKNQKII